MSSKFQTYLPSLAVRLTTGGLLNNAIGGFINSSVDLVVNNIGEDFTEFLVENVLDYVDVGNEITDIFENEAFDFVNDKSINFLDSIKENNLYLSPKSKEAIKELSKHFKKELTPAESFRLILKLMLGVAIDMSTLLYIKNPHKLDKDSLAILSLLFSFSKDAKDTGKHTNLSVVYAYEDEEFQPYKEVDDTYTVSKQLLDEQRLYTQRYAMLERPTSDIPHIAVKSSMFVGRQEELKNLNSKYYYSKKNKDIATLETISGEPGIGKTKLVKKHLEEIRKEEANGAKQIQLTLLNQVGHTSSNTGLGSLTDAIVKEASRLESVRTFKEKATKNTKEYIFGAVVDMVKSTLGVDALIDIGGAINDRAFLDGQMEQTKLNTVGDLDNKSQDKKQEQFTNLTRAVKQLKELSDDTMPIVLFIDDLQWIDEDSSEYLIQHFIKEFNVHIVATIRPSDATTILKKAYESKEQHPYEIALLKKVDIKLEEDIDSNIDTSRVEFNATNLLGLDAKTLKELISQVIKPIDDDETKQEVLANTIIEKFEDKNAKGTANTLFAVETINMLCDKKLYTSQDKETEIEQLILTGTYPRFNPDIKEFKTSLENTFDILNQKYSKAFEHINAEKDETEFKQKFNLMAYAVLEERMSILKIYFAEHGNAAVNTLLFSSLLGTPFNSTIVKNVLEALSTTEEELLQPLKQHILKDEKCNKISLTASHYEIIEEVYEILSRYVAFDSSYEYRHSLLNIFLDKQLEYQLDDIFIENRIGSKDSLYTLILKVIRDEEKKQNFYEKNEKCLNTKEYKNMLFFGTTEQNILQVAYHQNKTQWVKKYTTSLNNLANSYQDNNQLPEAIELQREVLNILKNLYEENPSRWATLYTTSLNNLASSYQKNNKPAEAIELEKESLRIRKDLYERNPRVWAEDYTTSLNNLAVSYQENNKLAEAIELGKESLRIRKDRYEENPSFWAEDYTTSLNNLAVSYQENNKLAEAIELGKESLRIRKNLYEENPSFWAGKYTTSLNNLAVLYQKNNKLAEAIELGKESLRIRKDLYEENPSVWAEDYTTSLNNLAVSYQKNNKLAEAIELFKESLRITKDLYEEKPSVWAEDYTMNLNGLASAHYNNNQFTEASKLFKEYFNINNLVLKDNMGEAFIYPFIKWYQCKIRLSNIDALKRLDILAKNLISLYKENLDSTYQEIIQKIHKAYLPLKDNEDDFKREKYTIFYNIFMGN